jgi:hypothetical protein
MTLAFPDYDGHSSRQPAATCEPAWALVAMVEQTILAKFTPDQTVTPTQVAAAQDLLKTFYKERLATLAQGHYVAASGSHNCLPDVFAALSFRISALGLMQPEPKPVPVLGVEPLPPEGVIRHLEKRVRTGRREMYVGTDEPPPDDEESR